MKIGVLALQGAVSEHVTLLAQCGAATKLIKELSDLKGIDGLVLPGGESTTMHKLLAQEQLLAPLRQLIAAGLPIFGTCAGLVLLAQPESLNGIDAQVVRNGFGRQKDSFETELKVTNWARPFTGVFIRAPYLVSLGTAVTPLATLADGKIIAAEQANVLVTAFHPELTGDARFHQLFLEKVAAYLAG